MLIALVSSEPLTWSSLIIGNILRKSRDLAKSNGGVGRNPPLTEYIQFSRRDARKCGEFIGCGPWSSGDYSSQRSSPSNLSRGLSRRGPPQSHPPPHGHPQLQPKDASPLLLSFQ